MVSSITFPIDSQKETKGEKQKRKITLSYFSSHYNEFIFSDDHDYERKAPKMGKAKNKISFLMDQMLFVLLSVGKFMVNIRATW